MMFPHSTQLAELSREGIKDESLLECLGQQIATIGHMRDKYQLTFDTKIIENSDNGLPHNIGK